MDVPRHVAAGLRVRGRALADSSWPVGSAAQRRAVLALVERLGLWAALFDGTGRLLETSPSLQPLLTTGEPALRAAMHRAAAAALSGPAALGSGSATLDWSIARVVRTARSAGRRYRLRAARTAGDLEWLDDGALVLVERLRDEWCDDTDEWTRYRLTPRETEVAGLLARGFAPERIAEALSVSRHTARRHIESIETKLSVHSRAEAAVKLLRSRPPSVAG
jgi:DNA-binding CsgD family transcriptional regulator